MYSQPMVHVVNIHEAKTHFSKLLAEIERGEEVIIARAGTYVAKLVPLSPTRPRFGEVAPKLVGVDTDALLESVPEDSGWAGGIEP